MIVVAAAITAVTAIAALEALAAAGANPCAVDERGSEALMAAAYRGHVAVARWILDHANCDVNHRTGAGQTALMMASLFGREEVVGLLLERGADPGIVDLDGNTASSLAKNQRLFGLVEKVRFTLL